MARADPARDDPKLRLDRLLSPSEVNPSPGSLTWLSEAKATISKSGRVLDRLLSGIVLQGDQWRDRVSPSPAALPEADGEHGDAIQPNSESAASDIEVRIASVELTLKDQTSVLGRLTRAISSSPEDETRLAEDEPKTRAGFRRDASRFATSFPPPPPRAEVEVLEGAAPTTFRDSRIDRRRRRLVDTFGPSFDNALIGQATAFANLARNSGSPVADAIDDIVAARWILDGNTELSLSSVAGQLRILAEFVSQSGANSRSAFELHHVANIIDHLRKVDLGETLIAGVRLNGLLAVMASQDAPPTEMSKALGSAEGRTVVLREAILEGSARAEFSALLNREERNWLLAATTGTRGVPLFGFLLWSDSDQLKERFDLATAAGVESFVDWLWGQGIWRTGLAHLASAEHFESGRLRIEGSSLIVPAHIEESWAAAASRSGATPTSRTAVEDIVIAHGGFVADMIDGSIFEEPRKPHGVANSQFPRPGRKRVTLNMLVSFGQAGESDTYTIGPNWSTPEADHRWTLGHSAMLAFDLDASDASSPLDLQIAFHLGCQTNQRVTLRWNGNLVWRQHVTGGTLYHAKAYLGRAHRGATGPNILTISNSSLFLPSLSGTTDDPRSLGVALRHLVLIPRCL